MVGIRASVAAVSATVVAAFLLDAARVEQDLSAWFFKLTVIVIASIGFMSGPVRTPSLGGIAAVSYVMVLALGEAPAGVRVLETATLLAVVLAAGRSTEEFDKLARVLRSPGRAPLRLDDATQLIQAEMKRARRTKSPFSLVAVDVPEERGLSRFRLFGLESRDSSKHDPAELVHREIRTTDSVLLKAGTVIVLCPDTARRDAEQLSRRICDALSDRGVQEHTARLATFPDDGLGFDVLLEKVLVPRPKVGALVRRVTSVERRDASASEAT